MNTVLHVLLIVVMIAVFLFLLSFLIFFFNLDMKFAAKLEPLLLKYHDRKGKGKK